MRQKEEIGKKLTELYDKRLKLRFRRYLKRSYFNCEHNSRVVVDSEFVNKVGCCLNKKIQDGESITICNDDKSALSCKYYNNLNNKKNIEERFVEDISNPKICGQKEPKIAVLLWVLHNNKEFPEEKEVGIWKKIWRRIWKKKTKTPFQDGSV